MIDTIVTDKKLKPAEEIALSLMHLRDELYSRIKMADSDTSNLVPIVWRINSCLYSIYRRGM